MTGGFSVACNPPGDYNAGWGNLPSPTLPDRAGGRKEVASMEQFLLDVLAGFLAGLIVLFIDRKFFR